MSQTKFLVMLAGAALGLGASGALAQSDADRAYSAELSADAVNKTQYMAKANGFVITDGTNKLRVGGFTQFRYNMNWRDNPGDAGEPHDSGFTNGFEMPRTRLIFSGNVLDPNLSFKIEGQFSDGAGDETNNFGLLDAFTAYKFTDEFTLAGGQFQIPLMREWYSSPFGTQGVDFGVVTQVFSPGYSQGVWGIYQSDAFKAIFGLDDGMNAANTQYASATEADYGLFARLEGKFSGDWNRFNEFASWKSDSGVASMLGGGLHYQHNGNTASPASTAPNPQMQLYQYTIDGTIEFGGANLYAAFVGRHTDPDDGGGNSVEDFGFELAGGFFVAEQDELYGRWDWVIPDDDRTGTGGGEDDDFHCLTFGWNHYLVPDSNAAKFTAELAWFLNEIESGGGLVATNQVSTDILPSNEDDQVLIRFQFQLAF
ncbi:MAG: hypothetical protein IT435_02950 [Phycisphaerales bacterium]|nr:hypothetical protein [Phycisphaerales bacterium]